MAAIIHKNQIIGQATDTSVLVKDTVGWTCNNLLQNTGPSSATIGGITFTKIENGTNEDGTVVCSGTAIYNVTYPVNQSFALENGVRYVLNGCPEGGGQYKYGLGLNRAGSALVLADIGEGYDFNADGSRYTVNIYISQGMTVTGLLFKPMIHRFAIKTNEYIPHHLSVEEELALIESAVSGIVEPGFLLANSWVGTEYSFESLYPSTKYDIEIEPDGDRLTNTQYTAWSSAGVVGMLSSNRCKAFGAVPTEDIPIIIKITEKK
jgi:hypothetical protein